MLLNALAIFTDTISLGLQSILVITNQYFPFPRGLEGFLYRLTFKIAEVIGVPLTPTWINS